MRKVGRYLALGSVVGLAGGLVVAITYGANAASAESLLSKGRPAESSSVELTDGSFAASKAFDGNSATRWASAEGSDPEWIMVDLGAPRAVTHVRLAWETAYAKTYQIQTSTDRVNWRTIYSTTTGDGGNDNLTDLSGTARYVRMYGTERGTKWGYSLWEMRVYGAASQDPSAPASVPSATPSATPSSSPSAIPSSTKPPASPSGRVDLTDPRMKDIAMQLVSSAENSSLDWRAQYKYIEDIGDGRGYTAGIIGFCSGTGDMLEVVERYTKLSPSNVLAKYLPALRKVNGTDSHEGLDPNFPADWRKAAADQIFQQAQDAERDATYFDPAVSTAKSDGLRALGQFIYYDAIVMHGPGNDGVSFGGIRKAAMSKAKTPAQGGDEVAYLNAFLDARVAAMRTEEAHSDTSRVDTAQRVFLRNGNLDLDTPLTWKVYGDTFTIS